MSPRAEPVDDVAVTVDQLLELARARLRRLTPRQAFAAARRGALLVDIRSERQRDRDGIVPGAHFVPRNVLEWRLDPRCESRDPALARADARLVLFCDEGFQSSLAAATLQRLGIRRATDVIGGFQAWRAAGLPVDPVVAGAPSSATRRVGDRARGAPRAR